MNYPNGIKKSFKINTSNRGMNLENDINESNLYYRNNDIGIIYKKPTPITINKVDYKNRKDAVIKEAHFIIPSTTDYSGVYKGKYIDFEAKETRKNYFPLTNIHAHQIEHLKKIRNCGGIGFIIVRFCLENKIYLLEIDKIENFLDNNSRKSIPKDYFMKHGYLIEQGYNPRLNYLKIVDLILRRDENEKNMEKE